jgi:TonB family protein
VKPSTTEKSKYKLIWAFLFSLLFHFTAFVFLLPLLAARPLVRALRSKDNAALKVALLLAFLLHVCLFFPLAYQLLRFRGNAEEAPPVMVDLWGAAEEKEKTPEEELESYEPRAEMPDGQVVQAPKIGKKRRPARDTKFLSEHDNAVEKETAASLRIPGGAEASPSLEIQGSGGKSTRDRQGGAPENLLTVGPPSPNIPESEKGDVLKTTPGEISPENIRLNPSETAMRAALAGTGLDRLEGVAVGDATALNTKEWSFASFFNRVKSRVEQHWHPDREFRQRDPYGNIYGFKDRTTVLLVILHADGRLKKTYVMEQSGALFLDEEASEAVEKAAPFPNVPERLLDKHDNLVKFTFHFVVQVGAAPVFRMRRY